MKKLLIIPFVLLVLTIQQSCKGLVDIDTSAAPEEKIFNNTDFDEIFVTDRIQVELTYANEDKLIIKTNPDVFEYLDIKQINQKLYLQLKKGKSLPANIDVLAYVSCSSIKNISLAKASEMVFTNTFTPADLKLTLSGASKLSAPLDCNHLDLEASGASSANLAGFADELDVNLSGKSKLSDYYFYCINANVVFSGQSEGQISIAEEVRYNGSGGSILEFQGSAEILQSDLSGDSKIIRH